MLLSCDMPSIIDQHLGHSCDAYPSFSEFQGQFTYLPEFQGQFTY